MFYGSHGSDSDTNDWLSVNQNSGYTGKRLMRELARCDDKNGDVRVWEREGITLLSFSIDEERKQHTGWD